MSLQERARGEAAEWFARRRRGVMTLQERADYETWSRVRVNSAAMGEMERLWQVMEGLEPSAIPAVASREISSLRRSALVAILCVAGLGVGMISYAGHSDFWTRLDWVER